MRVPTVDRPRGQLETRVIEAERIGTGPELVLVHGLGGSRHSWSPVLASLAAKRHVIAIDLPGHGDSPTETDSGTFDGLADSLERYLTGNGFAGVDVAGVSLGGRLVLEMARRGVVGDTVAIDPGGFWRGWERTFFRWTLTPSLRLVQALRGQLPFLSAHALSRTALLSQLSARPWALSPELVERELEAFASTPTAAALIRNLAKGPMQEGPRASGEGRTTIAWGRKDRLCLPRQADRAQAAFPDARMHWFANSGHYPIWDCPDETAALIVSATGGGR